MNFNLSQDLELSCKYNIISYRRKNQERVLDDVQPDHPGLVSYPLEWLSVNLTPLEIKVLNKFVTLSNLFRNIYASYANIADSVGCSVRTVAAAVKKLRELKLIDNNYRHLKTNQYKISPFLLDIKVRQKLCKLIKALYYFPAYLLGVLNLSFFDKKTSQSEYCIQLDKFNKNYLNTVTVLSTVTESNSNAHTHARRQESNLNSHNPNTVIKKESSMSSIENFVPRSDIAKISCLNLTPWGQMKLTAIPNGGIRHAEKNFNPNANNPYAWFFKDCLWWCNKNNIKVDFTAVDLLAKEYGRPDDAQMYIPRPVSSVTVQKTTQRVDPNYCCGSCHINKTQGPMTYTGKYQLCDKIRKENFDKEGYNSGGELFNDAKKNLYTKWSTLEGVKDLEETRRRFGYKFIKAYVDGLLAPDDHLPEEEPVDFIQYIFTRASSPF